MEDQEAEVRKKLYILLKILFDFSLGGRDNPFGSNRANNNPEDSGENGGGGGGDDTSVPSSSWSRGGYHSRGGGSFGNRVRSYDDR